MTPFGPQYCETPALIEGGFPVEFINTISNAPTVVLGLVAFFLVWKFAPRAWELYVLSFLLFATGVGSTLWHGTREALALTFDVAPGISFLLFFAYAWGRRTVGILAGAGAIAFLLGSQYLAFQLLPALGLSPFFVLYGSVLALGAVLVALSFRKFGETAWMSVGAIASALFAASMRTLDGEVCSIIPFGTHLLWHVFLGLAAFLCVLFLLRVRQKETGLHEVQAG